MSERRALGVPATREHSALYNVLNSSSSRHASPLFNRCLTLLILVNVLSDVLVTVDALAARWGGAFDAIEAVSTGLFVLEYAARFAVAGERLKYAGARGRLAFVLEPARRARERESELAHELFALVPCLALAPPSETHTIPLP